MQTLVSFFRSHAWPLPRTVWNERAPVGQSCTHVPHMTQLDSPMGVYMSDVRVVDDPRPVKFQTLFICISPQAFTQRPQRMQRFSLRRSPLLDTVSTVRSRCGNMPSGSATS